MTDEQAFTKMKYFIAKYSYDVSIRKQETSIDTLFICRGCGSVSMNKPAKDHAEYCIVDFCLQVQDGQ